MTRLVLGSLLLWSSACAPSDPGSTPTRPAGTPTDPVAVCERLADVCRLDGSRLGVCIKPGAGTAADACAGRTPCLVCMSQH